MLTIHIPDGMATKSFKECKLSRLMTGEEEGGRAYSVLYVAYSQEVLDTYQKVHAPSLQNEHNKLFAGKFAAFRTELKIIEEFTHES